MVTMDRFIKQVLPVTFDELCERGRIAAQSMDEGRWQLGDLACEVETQYGYDKIADFARNVNITKASARGYRLVSGFYEPIAREKFIESAPNVVWTHFRIAMQLREPSLAYKALNAAANGNLTTDAFIKLVKGRVAEINGTPPTDDGIRLKIGARSARYLPSQGELVFAIDDADAARSFAEYVKANKPELLVTVKEVR